MVPNEYLFDEQIDRGKKTFLIINIPINDKIFISIEEIKKKPTLHMI